MAEAFDAELKRVRLEETLSGDFVATLKERVDRHFEVEPPALVPNSTFAAVSAECRYLYRDGHYYGTISLAQSVAEGLVRFLCERGGWMPGSNFEKNLRRLRSHGSINERASFLLTTIWESRDDYHHLNVGIEQDKRTLGALASVKLQSLNEIEKNLFAFSVVNGAVIPVNPQYWDQAGDTLSVYLQID